MKKSNPQLASQIANTSIRVARWLRASDPPPTLTRAQISALGIIVMSGRITPSALAALEEVKRPTIARTIGQLENCGLIRRSQDEQDARSVWLRATPAGLTRFRDGQRRTAKPLAKAIRSLTAAERATLQDAFDTLERLIDTELASHPTPSSRPASRQ